ncbi:MAG TPA: hypothetical protein VEP72_01595 [Microbacterium sp.]|nr:hypothetical protein [Microbacterium sp.]
MILTPEGEVPEGSHPGDEAFVEDTLERTALSSRRSRRAARAAVASDVAPQTADARAETDADDPLDSTIVIPRATTRIEDDTVRGVRVARATPAASAPGRAAPASGRTASSPATGRVAHTPAVGAERYARRAAPAGVPVTGEDDVQSRRTAPPALPPRAYADAPVIDRAIRSTARRRAVLLGAAILLALGSAAVVLVVLLGGSAA